MLLPRLAHRGAIGGGRRDERVETPDAPPLAPFDACTVTTYRVPAESANHVAACSALDFPETPPAGGDHYGQETTFPSIAFDSTTSGRPRRYYTTGTLIYWDPHPDATHTVRYYGLKVADDITAAGTFAYTDMAALAVAQFAVKMLRTGKDDDVSSITEVGMQVFGPVIQSMARFNRDRPPGYDYRYYHPE